MTYRRPRHAGLRAALGAFFLVIAGGAAVWAQQQGFFGTAFVAVLIAIWLTALQWRAIVRPRGHVATTPVAEDAKGDRIMLRVLLDQAPGALLAVENGIHVRALNRAARKLFETDDRVLPVPPALTSPSATRLRHGGRSWRIDRANVRGVGVTRTLIALVDVEPEEHAAEARATRELLRVLGHEVMNAMAPIASLAESALAVLDAPERRDRLLPEILGTLARRAEGLRRFTEAYRQVARLPEPTLAPVRLADLFADLSRLFDGEWKGRATLVIEETQGADAALDRDQIVQALLALLRNGVEAGLAADGPAVVRLSVTVGRHRLTFHVVDSGNGINPTDRASIFLPFFTTKSEGNGVGLAAARQIAQAHGGDAVFHDSRPTQFTLSLPR